MMKKFIAVLLAALMVLSLAACGDAEPATDATEATQATEATEATEATQGGDAAYAYPACSDTTPVVELNGAFDKTLVKETYAVTAIGQSADIDVVGKLLDKAGVTYTSDTLMDASALTGVGTLFVAAGASTKGLGAAGISADDELARAQAIFSACEAQGITVVLCHVGGSARRGTLSDQFTDLVMAAADYMVVVEEGNSDGYFTDYAASHNIPLALVKSMSTATQPIGALFN